MENFSYYLHQQKSEGSHFHKVAIYVLPEDITRS